MRNDHCARHCNVMPERSMNDDQAVCCPSRVGRSASVPCCGRSSDRLWVVLSRLWPNWRSGLAIVQPETVIKWHRKGFKLVVMMPASPCPFEYECPWISAVGRSRRSMVTVHFRAARAVKILERRSNPAQFPTLMFRSAVFCVVE